MDENFENVEASDLCERRFIGDSSSGATNICMIYNYMIKIIMIMYVSLIAMHAVKTIEVYTLAEENLKKIPVDQMPPQAKLKLKRGITMDSGAGNNVPDAWSFKSPKFASRRAPKMECATSQRITAESLTKANMTSISAPSRATSNV